MNRRPAPLRLVLIALLFAPLAEADKVKAKDHFRKGMARYTLEKWDDAIAEFEEGYTEEPDPSFLYNIAQAHRMANRPKVALEFYRKFLNRKPDAPNRGDIEQQIAALEKSLESGEPMAPSGTKPGAGKPETKPVVVTRPETKPVVVAKPETKPVVVAKPETNPVVVTKPEASPDQTPERTQERTKVALVVTPPASEKPELSTSQVPLGAVPPTPADEVKPQKKKWPMWVGIGVAAAVVVGGGTAAAVLLSRPSGTVLAAENLR